MAKTVDYFHSGVFDEHLQEAAHLYARRLAAMHDSSIPWPRVGEIEQRFDAHVNALVVGKDAALQLCRERATGDDPGDIHAALRVLCRAKDRDGVMTALPQLDVASEDIAGAAARALRQEAPAAWQADLARLLNDDSLALHGVLASVFGYRRFAAQALLMRKLAMLPDSGLAELAWALGRVGSGEAVPALRQLLEHEEETVCSAAAVALMRLGDREPVERALLLASTRRWPATVLGIGGDRRAVNVLLDALKGQAASHECVLALGLLGDLAAVAPLLGRLDDEELGETAAIALNTITGAGLYNEILVPDALGEEDDATRSDGEPFGSWELRPLRDAQEWRAWLSQHKAQFHREAQWRMGRPHGASAVFASLSAARSPYAVRSASYEELVVRFGLKVPFECNLLVGQQTTFLRAIRSWVDSR